MNAPGKDPFRMFAPSFGGSQRVAVGSGAWGVPMGSRVARIVADGQPVVLIREPSGRLRTLTTRFGNVLEVETPPDLIPSIVAKYFPDLS